jgi:AraC-like DNA-binding protein
LNQIIRELAGSPLNFMNLYDADGQFLISQSLDHKSVSAKSHEHDGKELSHIRSAYTGWTLQSGLEFGSFANILSNLFYGWIVLGFLLIAIAIAWIIVVSRRNYRPIEQIVKQLAHYNEGKNTALTAGDKEDEFNFIQSAIIGFMRQSEHMEEQMKEHIVFRNQHFFQRLLAGEQVIPLEEWQTEVKALDLPEHIETVVVVCVEIDQYTEFCTANSSDAQEQLKQELSEIAKDVARSEGIVLWGEWTDHNQMSLLCLPDSSAQSYSRVTHLCDSMLVCIRHLYNFTVTIGIGDIQEEIVGIGPSAHSALTALRYKPSLGNNRIIRFPDIASKPQENLFKHLQTIRTIAQSFRLGEKVWQSQLNELYNSLLTHLFVRDDLINLMNYFVYQLHKEITELPAEYQAIWDRSAAPQLKTIFETKDTLVDIYAALRVILISTDIEMQAQRENRNYHQMFQRVKQYIQKHYVNPDLSLTHLSTEFGLSAAYLSRLFKEEFGVKFIDYVTQVRMEQAKPLLMSTSLAVQDVAAIVGYTQALTFIRVFKKHSGLTPGLYRKQYANLSEHTLETARL